MDKEKELEILNFEAFKLEQEVREHPNNLQLKQELISITLKQIDLSSQMLFNTLNSNKSIH